MKSRLLTVVTTLALLAGLAAQAPAALVGHWTFSDSAGPGGSIVNQAQPGDGDGVLVGNAFASGGMLHLGGGDYVSIANHPIFDDFEGGNGLTIAAWIHPDTLTSRPSIFSTRRSNPAGSFQLEVGTGNGGSGRLAVSSVNHWSAESPNNAILPGVWTHVAYTRDNDVQKLYVNGVEQTLLSDNLVDYQNNSHEKLIGAGAGLNSIHWFRGRIRDVAIYDEPLLPADFFTEPDARVYFWNAGGSGSPSDGPGSWNDTGGTNWHRNADNGHWGNTTDDTAVFGVGNGAAGTIAVGDVTANAITFNAAGSGTYTLTGGAITLSGAMPAISAIANAKIDSVLAGSEGLVKFGAGTLTLGGDNTFTGGTTVHGGTLIMTNPDALGSGPVTHAGGRVWFSFGNGSTETVANDFMIAGGGAGGGNISPFTIRGTDNGAPTATTTVRLTGVVSGGDPNLIAFYTDTAVGGNHHNVLVLDNENNTFQGAIELYRGSLEFTSDGALGNENNSIRLGGHNANSQFRFGADDIVLAPTREVAMFRSSSVPVIDTQQYTGTIAGAVTGPGGLRKVGDGTLILAGENTYTGSTTVSAGTLALSGGSIPNSQVTLNNAAGVTLRLDSDAAIGSLAGGGAAGGNVNLHANTLTTGGNNASTNFSGVISGDGALIKEGTGALTLDGDNSYTGGTWVNAGALAFATADAKPQSGTITVANGAALGLRVGNESFTLTHFHALYNNTFDGVDMGDTALAGVDTTPGDLTIGDALTGARGLAKLGSNTLSLSGANSYTGGTLAYGGRILMTNPEALGSGAVTHAGGQVRFSFGNGSTETVANDFMIAGAGHQGTFVIRGTDDAAPNQLTTVRLTGVISGGAPGVTAIFTDTAAGGNHHNVLVLDNENNTFEGIIELYRGSLEFTSDGALGNADNNIRLGGYNANSQFRFGADGIVLAPTREVAMYLSSVPVIDTQQYTGTIEGAVTGLGGLRKVGDGTLILAGENTYAGATTVSAGTLALDYSGGDQNKLSSAALILGGGTVNLHAGSHTESVASTTLLAGATSAVTRTSGTSVLDMGAITRNAGASIDFGAENIAMTSTPNDATGILGMWATVGEGDWAVHDGNGYVVRYSDYVDVTRLDGAKTIPDAASHVRIVEGAAGAPAIIHLAAETTSINTLNQSAVGGTSAATVDPNGRTLQVNGILLGADAGALTIGTGVDSGTLRTATAGGGLVLNNQSATNHLTTHSVIADNTGASSLTKAGAGTVILAADNTYTGSTTVSAGTLQVGDGATGSLGSGDYAGAISNSGQLIFNQAGDQILSGVISGAGTLIQQGDGTLTLSGNNTFTGNVTVRASVLKLGRNTALGALNTAATKTTVESGATLDVNGQSGGSNAYGVTIAGTGVDGAGALVNNGSHTSSGVRQTPNITLSADATIGGTGNFAMISPGWAPNTLDLNRHTLTKAGTNTFYMGFTTVTPGTVRISGGTVSQHRISDGNAAAFVLDDTAGVALELNNLNLSVGSLAGGGPTGGNVSLGSGTLTVGALDGSTEYVGVISGSGALMKTGSGTLTLSGASTYTGPTAVNDGTLLVSGSLLDTSGVTVSANGTLGGSGSIGAPVVVHGTLSPGMSPGVLTMDELLLGSASTTTMEVNGLLRGAEYDGVAIVQEDSLTYGGTLALSFGNTSIFDAGTVFNLFDLQGTASGTFDEVVSTGYYGGSWIWDDIDDVFALEAGWQTLLFSHVTGDLTVIPEPGAWLLLLSALACGLLVRRRK